MAPTNGQTPKTDIETTATAKAMGGGSTNGEGAEVGDGPSRHEDVASDMSHHSLQLLHRLSPTVLLVRQPVDQLATEENNSARTVQLGALWPFHALSFVTLSAGHGEGSIILLFSQ